MSAIAGALNLRGTPLPAGLLGRMTAAASYRAHDGEATWEGGAVGLAHSHHWTTPEEVGEQQPLASEDGRYHLTADARIDNREELIAALRGQGFPLPDGVSDAGLILASYRCWKDACAPRLLGDFAFAVWDAVERRLFLARDVMGLRQLYYTTVEGVFYFASTLGALRMALPHPPALNDALIEEFLRDYFQLWVHHTVYQGIDRLPPAHTLVVEEGEPRPRLYYVLGSTRFPENQSDADWIAAFRRVLTEAIRCRLRSTTPVAVATGGGLDSSAVACVAHDLTSRHPDLPDVQLHSTSHSEPEADERQYFDVVAACCSRFRAVRVPGDDCWALKEFGTDGGYPLDEPELYVLRSHTLALLRSVRSQGCRVVLSGEGANQGLGHAVYYSPRALWGFAWRDWRVEWPNFVAASEGRWERVLFHALVRPLIPAFVLERLRPLRPADTEWPAWVRRRHRTHPAGPPLARAYVHPPGLSLSARISHDALRSGFDLARLAAIDVTCRYAGTEWRLPFHDRRVVELLLAMPARLRSWRGQDRRILREAFRGILPESVRIRRGKASFAGRVRAGFRERERSRIEGLIMDSHAAGHGFVDPERLRTAFEAYWEGAEGGLNRLSRPLALEAWLRTLPKGDIL